jgi:hypothetical protein
MASRQVVLQGPDAGCFVAAGQQQGGQVEFNRLQGEEPGRGAGTLLAVAWIIEEVERGLPVGRGLPGERVLDRQLIGHNRC